MKRLLLELPTTLLETRNGVSAARVVGRNKTTNDDVVWVLSKKITVSSSGDLLSSDQSPVLWLERPHNGGNLLIKDSLACEICTPSDGGEAFFSLCGAIQSFMPENFVPN